MLGHQHASGAAQSFRRRHGLTAVATPLAYRGPDDQQRIESLVGHLLVGLWGYWLLLAANLQTSVMHPPCAPRRSPAVLAYCRSINRCWWALLVAMPSVVLKNEPAATPQDKFEIELPAMTYYKRARLWAYRAAMGS